MERREVSVSDHFDDDDDPIDGNADSNVCDMVKAGNAEYIHSPGIAQFFWKHLLYLFVSAVYEVVADQLYYLNENIVATWWKRRR